MASSQIFLPNDGRHDQDLVLLLYPEGSADGWSRLNGQYKLLYCRFVSGHTFSYKAVKTLISLLRPEYIVSEARHLVVVEM